MNASELMRATTGKRHGMGGEHGLSSLSVCVLTVIFIGLYGVDAPAATSDPFTAEADVSVSTGKAGGHPNLTVDFNKRPDRCPILEVMSCPFRDFYTEQDLKKIELRLPPGLMADANAAPYCEPFVGKRYNPVTDKTTLHWMCSNPEAAVGTVFAYATYCWRDPVAPAAPAWGRCLAGLEEPFPEATLILPGMVYNARPEPGEQGHLIVLWPGGPEDDDYGNSVRTDVSVKLREGDLGLDTVGDNIPDIVYQFDAELPGTRATNSGQIFNLALTFFGQTGSESGHPLLTNPTSCEEQSIAVTSQGYEFDAIDLAKAAAGESPVPGFPPVTVPSFQPGTGDGRSVEQSVSFQPTGCEAVPYSPNITLAQDTTAPGRPFALTATVSQADDEAHNKSIRVDFPKGIGINIGSTVTPCTADAAARRQCPESSRMGTASATSRLLPEPGLLPGNDLLEGPVYLTGFEGSKLSLSIQLSGFVDLTINGTAGLNPDSTLTASFDNLPQVPIRTFTLSLFGGEKSMITNPEDCGSHSSLATFTSHSGKVETVEAPLQVTGCPASASVPEFDAELTAERSNRPTALELEVRARKEDIEELKFGIDRHMKVSNQGLRQTKRGTIEVKTEEDVKNATLKVKRRKKGKVRRSLTLQTTIGNLTARLYRTRFVRKKTKTFRQTSNQRKPILKKKTMPKSRLSLKSLPVKEGVKRVTVELNPDETRFLRTPKGCKRALRFLAITKTEDGRKHYLKKNVRLKGAKCRGKKK